LTDLAIFSTALADIQSRLGAEGWLTRADGSRNQVRPIISWPELGELAGEAPVSLDNRFVDLTAADAAATNDLVTVAGETWILSGEPRPDLLGLGVRWIGVPLGFVPPFTVAYHPDGYPLVAFDGDEWGPIP
jgi:hypothetical protein